ncbi:diguanylate cyclase [Sulfurimonas sp. SAG-AH-194-C21]|nr:diguanylate cyclase [Sulfurimonas sp. SAG-AH-194-C21]MDF1882376.1 diguanylate cyclase [Sulfurimonas sp. SAG-AH-194-C21]
MNIKKFLQSNFTFDEKEYEVKLQHMLFNGMLSIVSIFLTILVIVRFYQENYFQSTVDFFIVLVSLASLFYIKRAKENCQKLAHPLLAIFFALILITLFNIPSYMIATGWFIVLILPTFYLAGPRYGFFITFMAIVSLMVLLISRKSTYTLGEFIYMFMPIFLSSLFIYTYEKRIEYAKQELQDINKHLHKEIIHKEFLLKQAHYDYLTKLPNRILFEDRLQQAIIKSNRSNKDFAILFIDLDLFKDINDIHGHTAGDIVLSEIASRFKSALREEDTVARFGGDEFVCIIEQLEDCSTVSTVAQKLIKKAEENIFIPQKISVTCSIGISIYKKDTKDEKELLHFADTAMYNAKSLGKNQYSFYNDC